MQAEFLFLGTGGSSGVPMIGCSCDVCLSSDAHNKRLRPSALILSNQKKLLLDAGPDFRFQALRWQIDYLDGVLLTHTHFDHVGGLDELRVYYLRHHIHLPLLLSRSTFDELKRRYYYLFQEKSLNSSLAAQLDFQVIENDRGKVKFLDCDIQYMHYDQAGMAVTGYRFGSLAYISDIRLYPDTLFQDLAGIDTLILSALRHAPSVIHFNLEEAIAFAKKVGAKRTYFTHIGHELEHRITNSLLPEGMQLAFDGLKLEFDDGS